MLNQVPVIPHVFRTDKADALKTDLDRFSDGMREWIRRSNAVLEPIPTLSRTDVFVSGDVSVGYNETLRVGPRASTDTINVALPRVSTNHSCRTFQIIRTTIVGLVVLWPTDCLINGGANLILLSSPILTIVMSDGQNFYASNPGSGVL